MISVWILRLSLTIPRLCPLHVTANPLCCHGCQPLISSCRYRSSSCQDTNTQDGGEVESWYNCVGVGCHVPRWAPQVTTATEPPHWSVSPLLVSYWSQLSCSGSSSSARHRSRHYADLYIFYGKYLLFENKYCKLATNLVLRLDISCTSLKWKGCIINSKIEAFQLICIIPIHNSRKYFLT